MSDWIAMGVIPLDSLRTPDQDGLWFGYWSPPEEPPDPPKWEKFQSEPLHRVELYQIKGDVALNTMS